MPYLLMSHKATFFSALKKLLLITLSIVACLIALIMFFGLTKLTVKIEGNSMMPAIQNGDRLLMSKAFFKPKVGGIYSVAEGSTLANPDKGLVKRVIAGPGDVLEFNAHTGEWLSYNGNAVVVAENNDLPWKLLSSKETDSYGALLKLRGAFNHLLQLPMYRLLPEQSIDNEKQRLFLKKVLHYPYIQQRQSANGQAKVIVPAGHYFVMSDNWSSNLDSRFFGPLPERAFQLVLINRQEQKL